MQEIIADDLVVCLHPQSDNWPYLHVGYVTVKLTAKDLEAETKLTCKLRDTALTFQHRYDYGLQA